MARINIEDSLFKEKSYGKLMLKLGSQRMALGAIVEAFSLAQKHFLNIDNDRLIPLDVWEREEMGNELIDCGFAEIRKNGVYVRGSESQFSWLLQRSDAGKRSQKIKAEKAATTVDDRQRPSDGSQPLPLPLSLPLSQSLKKSKSKSKSKDITSNKKFAEDPLNKIVDLWNLNSKYSKCSRLSGPRLTKLKSQFNKYPEIEHWSQAIEKFNASEFCTNKWRPGFDDFLNETKRLRAIEGAYDNRSDKTKQQKIFDNFRRQALAVEQGEL